MLSHRGTPQFSSIFDWDSPWNKPSMTSWTPHRILDISQLLLGCIHIVIDTTQLNFIIHIPPYSHIFFRKPPFFFHIMLDPGIHSPCVEHIPSDHLQESTARLQAEEQAVAYGAVSF